MTATSPLFICSSETARQLAPLNSTVPSILFGSTSFKTTTVWPVTAATDVDWLGALAFNLLLFVVGVATLAEGVRGQNLAVVNLGMAVVALLIIVRFFDSDLGFIFKGLAFIFVGIGFLVANMLLSRRNRAVGERGP